MVVGLFLQDFYNYRRSEVEAICQDTWQAPALHTKSLFREIYKSGSRQPWTLTTLPKIMQQEGAKVFSLEGVFPQKSVLSKYDGSVKFLGRLADNQVIESVLMPEKGRLTLCVSSQVGCAQGCSFCYTARMGLIRHLSAGEIVGQVVMANQWIRAHHDWLRSFGYPGSAMVSNIVFMGMGEPLDNVENVSQAMDIMNDPYGLNIPLRRISVSTAGHLEGMKRLLQLQPKATLALSLHATTNGERSRLMPINRKWPIGDVLTYIKEKFHGTGRKVLIQYTVINGVNDSDQHAARLLDILADLPVKLNLIPLNDVEPTKFRSPDPQRLLAFRDFLHRGGIRVMVRYSKGQDIGAACGQLVTSSKA